MEKIEKEFKTLILRDVVFKLNDKVIKRGKIKVFNTKQFFIKFKIECDDETKDYEIPYPYSFTSTGGGFMLDYCLSAFVPPTEETYWRMMTLDKSKASKMHNNYLYIFPN